MDITIKNKITPSSTKFHPLSRKFLVHSHPEYPVIPKTKPDGQNHCQWANHSEWAKPFLLGKIIPDWLKHSKWVKSKSYLMVI